jgi:uncharacterized membrane-anchored protein
MRAKFILIVLLQVALLVGIIAYRHYWVATGEKILLKTAPVDPRDIFRGDYIDLSYDISQLDLDALGVKERFKGSERVYVILEKDPDGTFGARSISRDLPAGEQFIQGRVVYEMPSSRWEVVLKDDSGTSHQLQAQRFFGVKKGERVYFCLDGSGNVLNFFKEEAKYRPPCTGSLLAGAVEGITEIKYRALRVKYGIENYFVEEGKGRAIESSRNARELQVEVSLRKDGKGIIIGLFADGKLVR